MYLIQFITDHAGVIVFLAFVWIAIVECIKRCELGEDPSENEVEVRRKITRTYMLSLSYSNFILIMVNIIIASAAISSYSATVSTNKTLDRPYLGLGKDSLVDLGTVYTNATPSGQRVSPGLQIKMELKNYGNLPTQYAIYLSGLTGEVKPFQTSQNEIMPGQEIPLRWNLMFPKSVNTFCDLDKDLSIEIEYGEHILKLKPSYIDDPEIGSSDSEFVIHRIDGCGAPNQVRVWSIIEST